MFGEYYLRDLAPTMNIPMVERREFGFVSFDGWMLRHRSFKNREELTSFLHDSVPRDAYVSCACYEEPEEEMDRKGWLGADLIFDIDADHIPTPCDKVHDEWTCVKCGFAGKGVVPENCPACGAEKFEDSTWPCEVCLDSARSETIKLLDMLTKDYGLSQKEIRLFFSGHRGYHIHVESESVANLDTVARKEIVDYVSGLGFDLALHGLSDNGLKNIDLKGEGWHKRVAEGIYDLVLNGKTEDYRNIGLKKNVVEAMTKNKDTILGNWNASKPFGRIKGVGSETWRKIVEYSVKSASANVDTVVTTDIHRLIRLDGTLHGKTGLMKIEFPVSRIDGFDPLRSSIAFRGGTRIVFVTNSPEFRLGDQTFGPYRNQKVELPTAAAVLLLCKRRAEVAD